MMEANPQIFDKALEHLRRGRPADAERLFRQLLTQTHVIDRDWDEWLRGLIEAWRALGRLRQIGYACTYLHRFSEARAAFEADAAVVEVARCHEMEARVAPTPERARPLLLAAAEGYATAGHHGHAAIAAAQGGDDAAALRSWERVLSDPRLRGRPYEQALCHFNVGLLARRCGDGDGGHRHLVMAQRLLEEVADEFESRGERERAFDCYAIVLQLGKDSGSFENLAEGYINCIRVLKADNLKFYVLQYYEDFLRIALEREEFHAAATVFREAADYARRVGLIYDRGYMKRAAETWWRAADGNERDGGAVELTENAYLAAIDCYNSLGDFFHVRETYQKLATLGLPDKKRQRYAIVATRYASVSPEPVDAASFPEYLRQQHAYPPIWELDLIEWELDGDYASVCGAIIGDGRYADMIRRRALNVLLAHLDAIGPGGTASDDKVLGQIAQALGELQAYPALRPLERLFGHPAPAVRRGVMRAARNLYFKRTFGLITRGLRDEAKEVRQAALEAVAALHFAAAFDPLTRIVREHDDPRVKATALESLGAIATLEAGEFLIEVLRYEGDPLRDVARRLLTRFDNADIFPILRRHLEQESGPARALLEQILRGAPGRPNADPGD